MNGATHATSGLAVGLWTSEVAPGSGPVGVVVWAGTVAGAAIIPDIDHPKSKATTMWGPVTSVPTGWLRRVVKHRGVTHHPVVAVAVTLVAVGLAAVHPVTAALVVAVITGLVLTGLDHLLPGNTSRPITNFVLSWTAAAAVSVTGWDVWWLPLAAAVGVLTHIAGDALTKNGLLGLIRTGGLAERVIHGLLVLAIVAWAVHATVGFEPTVTYLKGLT